MWSFASEKTYTPLALLPGATPPWKGAAGGPIIDTDGVPAASCRLAVTLPRSTTCADRFVMVKVTSKAGPEISPTPSAVALIALTLATTALTLPPKDAVDVNGTGGAVVTVRAGTVTLMPPLVEDEGAGVLGADVDSVAVDDPALALAGAGDVLTEDGADALLGELDPCEDVQAVAVSTTAAQAAAARTPRRTDTGAATNPALGAATNSAERRRTSDSPRNQDPRATSAARLATPEP